MVQELGILISHPAPSAWLSLGQALRAEFVSYLSPPPMFYLMPNNLGDGSQCFFICALVCLQEAIYVLVSHSKNVDVEGRSPSLVILRESAEAIWKYRLRYLSLLRRYKRRCKALPLGSTYRLTIRGSVNVRIRTATIKRAM